MECSVRRRLLRLSSHLNPLAQTSLPSCISTSSCRSDEETNGEIDCVFCKIIRGESPAFKIFEDDTCLCILDTRPLSLGHSLIIPKCHFPSLDVTPPSIIGAMCSKVPLITNAVMKATDCDSFNLLVNNGEAAGQVIYHTHIHIIPRKSHDCLWASETFRRRPLKINQEAAQLASRIRENLSSLNDCEDSREQKTIVIGFDSDTVSALTTIASLLSCFLKERAKIAKLLDKPIASPLLLHNEISLSLWLFNCFSSRVVPIFCTSKVFILCFCACLCLACEYCVYMWRIGQTEKRKMTLQAAEQAEKLRQDGNVYFKKDRFAAAIDAYTEAITLCPNVPTYWTNRALCHRKRNEWTRVEEDCRRAVQLDHHSVKAHYMLGLALLERKEYKEGVRELEKALDLGRGANPNGYMVEEIWRELAAAKYLTWEHESTERSWNLQNLREACIEALKQKEFLDASETEGFVDENAKSNRDQLEALDNVFNKAAEDDTPSEVPDYLCCKITLDIFRDPVITPCGITYERGVILDHLLKVGKFDPITREPLYASQLVPNLAIKEAVRAYLEKHGWAYKVD